MSSLSVVTVAVIDSGWDRTIIDERVLPGVGLTPRDSSMLLRCSSDDTDVHGHGTSCTDLILQVAPRARIVPVRVFGQSLETSPQILIAAIKWVADAGIPLANISAGTVQPDMMHQLYSACEYARTRNVIIVAAQGAELNPSYPAIFEPVIGVGSGMVRRRHAFAYDGEQAIEYRARGMQQFARGLRGDMTRVSGSSFAAPIITGHVANILAVSPELDVNGVRKRLLTMQSYESSLHTNNERMVNPV